jgi:hypothetical protein
VRDLAGYFHSCEVSSVRDPETGEEQQALFANLKFADSEPGRLAYDQMREALDYQKRFSQSKDVFAGLSINGGGVSHPATIRGMDVNMVTEIQEAFSADIVTKPARGGRFVALMREARRAAAWNRGRAREARAGRSQGMATAVIDPKMKKHVLEARQAFKALGAAVEGKQAAEIPGVLKMLTEAVRRCGSDAGMKKLAESAVGKIAAFTKLLEQGDENLDPGTLVADIKDDVDRLDDLIGGGATGDQGGGEGEMEDAAAEGEGEEEGAEGEGAEGEGEGEDEQDYGMGEHDDAGAGPGGPGAMRYSCASCGETNRVMPPKGFRLARMGESAQGSTGHEALVCRLRRALEQKEQRFVTHNRETRQLLKENTELKARLLAGQRLQEASKMLREAGVPPDIMRAKALLPFEPEQWPTMIGVAKNALAKEAAPLQRGGAGPRGSGSGGAAGGGGDKETGAIFKEAYQRPHDIVG